MKNIFKFVIKVIIVIVIIIVVLIGLFYGRRKLKNFISDYERKNSKNLIEYVETHDWYCLNIQGEKKCHSMGFISENFQCDILDASNIKNFEDDYFITEDNNIYEYSVNKLYSNNQNCIKKEIGFEVKEIKGNYILSQYDKLYNIQPKFDDDNIYFEVEEVLYLSEDENIIKKILLNDSIKDILYLGSCKNGEREVIIVKSDNKIYQQTYSFTTDIFINVEYSYALIEEKEYVLYNQYGDVYMADLKTKYNSNELNYYINNMLTDEGYYYYGEIQTEECIKYKDIVCEKGLIESEIYKKFNNDIKILGKKYTVLTDNSIILTELLNYQIDKELKY